MKRLALRLLLLPLILLAVAWTAAATFLDGCESTLLSGAVAAALLAAAAASLFGKRRRRLATAAFAALFAAVLFWWFSIEPRNDRPWQQDVSRLAEAEIDGDLITLRNVRNFDYQSETDYVARWEERTYDLSRLAGVDMFLCYWGSPSIAHTIVSWRFSGAPPLAISIETRKEVGESYSTIRGFFRQYELHYVVADERDVIRLRTNCRGEDVYLYRLDVPLETARQILVDYLETIDDMRRNPRWYNALTHNCTTVIRHHAMKVAAHKPWNWRILLNGHLDELGYMRGTVDTSLPFPELRRRSRIVAAARAAGAAADFSARIRAGLPGFAGG